MPTSKHRRKGIIRPRRIRQRGHTVHRRTAPQVYEPDTRPYNVMIRGIRWQTARKEYKCQSGGYEGHCAAVIQPGERYCRITMVDLDAEGPRGKLGKYESLILCESCEMNPSGPHGPSQ